MSNTFYKYDSGMNIDVTILHSDGTPFDISEATLKEIKFVSPNDVTTVVDADFVTDGTDGKLRYTINDPEFLNAKGRWILYAYVESASYKRTSSKSWFNVV